LPVNVAGNWQRPDGTGTPPEHLHYLGRLSSSEMAERYGRACIFALPARYEPFGLSILEAALSGCALVLGDIPSLRELWAGAAIFVPPDDPDSLTQALHRLIADPAYLSAQGDLARRHARSYGTERMVARYLDAYAELLDATQPVPRHCDTAAVPNAAVRLGSRP